MTEENTLPFTPAAGMLEPASTEVLQTGSLNEALENARRYNLRLGQLLLSGGDPQSHAAREWYGQADFWLGQAQLSRRRHDQAS